MPKYIISIKTDMELEVTIGEEPEDVRIMNSPEVIKEGFIQMIKSELDEDFKFNTLEVEVKEITE